MLGMWERIIHSEIQYVPLSLLVHKKLRHREILGLAQGHTLLIHSFDIQFTVAPSTGPGWGQRVAWPGCKPKCWDSRLHASEGLIPTEKH